MGDLRWGRKEGHKSDVIDLVLQLKHETDLAILVYEDDPLKAEWLPRSVVEVSYGDPSPGFVTVTLPERLAIQKGLV